MRLRRVVQPVAVARALGLALLALGACTTEAPASGPEPPGPEAARPQAARPAAAPEAPATPPAPSAGPESPQAAAGLVLAYYGAIAEQDYRRAYGMWGPTGPPGQSFEAFESGFDQAAEVRAFVDAPGNPERSAGATTVVVPVNVTARASDGTEQRFEGDHTLRRVGDVAGAQPWQLRWHIARAHLREIR